MSAVKDLPQTNLIEQMITMRDYLLKNPHTSENSYTDGILDMCTETIKLMKKEREL